MTSSPSDRVVRALVVSNDTTVVREVSDTLQKMAASSEVCPNVQDAIRALGVRKFEALVVDLNLGEGSAGILKQLRASPSNRTVVSFAITDEKHNATLAFEAGANFVLERPLSVLSLDRTIKAAYALMVRERLRYFRYPVSISAAIRKEDAEEIRCEILNVSEGGIAIMTSVILQAGSELTVRFTLPGHSTAFAARSEICWCDGKGIAGLRFIAPSREQRAELKEWLARKLEESLPESVASKFRSNS